MPLGASDCEVPLSSRRTVGAMPLALLLTSGSTLEHCVDSGPLAAAGAAPRATPRLLRLLWRCAGAARCPCTLLTLSRRCVAATIPRRLLRSPTLGGAC